MLSHLSVENYALIESLDIELDNRLNIITGETGAGKSILLGALTLLLGGKNDSSAMKESSRNCVIEGTFEVDGYGLEAFFEQNDIDFSSQSVVRRIITPAGKSRSYINDIPVQLSQLKEFGSYLIDIHSQNQNLIISNEEFRIKAIDLVAESGELAQKYAAKYRDLCHLRTSLEELRSQAEASHKEEDWIRYQVEELSAAKLQSGEQAQLESELEELSNADRIVDVLSTAVTSLDQDEVGILTQLKNIKTAVGNIRDSYKSGEELAQRLESVLYELKDINTSFATDCERIEANPERLERVSERLNELYLLMQKHHTDSVDSLIEILAKYEAQLSVITSCDEQIEALQKEIVTLENECRNMASELHSRRCEAAPDFCKKIELLLTKLGMPDVRFIVEVLDSESLNSSGCDRVAFLFSANANHAAQPIEKTASGGEISRVMLALKATLAQKMKLPTIVFDEIDTGVSGRIADAMGEIITSLSQIMQVVDITHLPQVASKGKTHFVVRKTSGVTSITKLTDSERITEIATMLSGSQISDAAIIQAKVLLGID